MTAASTPGREVTAGLSSLHREGDSRSVHSRWGGSWLTLSLMDLVVDPEEGWCSNAAPKVDCQRKEALCGEPGPCLLHSSHRLLIDLCLSQ